MPDAVTLQRIKEECEKIELGTGFGQVLIVIQDGKVHHLKPQPSIFLCELDNNKEKVL